MTSEFQTQLDQIDWSAFDTAYGQATNVPIELTRLAGDDHNAAMDASHKLWCGLCHQHAYLSSAALPAYPFILRVLDTANDELTIEILDILVGFAVCSTRGPDGASPIEWERSLRTTLRDQLQRFETMTHHRNEEIAGFGATIVDNLLQYLE